MSHILAYTLHDPPRRLLARMTSKSMKLSSRSVVSNSNEIYTIKIGKLRRSPLTSFMVIWCTMWSYELKTCGNIVEKLNDIYIYIHIYKPTWDSLSSSSLSSPPSTKYKRLFLHIKLNQELWSTKIDEVGSLELLARGASNLYRIWSVRRWLAVVDLPSHQLGFIFEGASGEIEWNGEWHCAMAKTVCRLDLVCKSYELNMKQDYQINK